MAQTDDSHGDSHGDSQRIVVGVDGSDASAAALEWAADLASRIGASVEAVTTWQWPTGLGPDIPFPTGYDPAGDARGVTGDSGEDEAHTSATFSSSRVVMA